MREIPAVAARQFGAFSRAQAFDEGWTRGAIDHALSERHILRLQRGTYVARPVMDGTGPDDRKRQLAARAAGAVLHEPGSVASHQAAAVLANLSVINLRSRPCLTAAPSRRRAVPGVHLHRAQLDRPFDIVRSAAVERTSSARTVVDLARENGIDEAVVVGDSALYNHMTDGPKLERAVVQARHWPGIQRARIAVTLCNGASESALETLSRLRIGESDLPVPGLQIDLWNLRRLHLGRSDFFWEKYGVVGEADGELKYRLGFGGNNSEALIEEKRRQERMEQAGLIVVRWGWRELGDFSRLRLRIAGALARGARIAAADRGWLID
jgi:hypothetical protein